MRALQTDVNDANALPERRGDRGVAHRLVQRTVPETADLRYDTHRDVQRLTGLEIRATAMPLSGACARGLSPGAASFAAAAEQVLLDVPFALARRPRRHEVIMTIVVLVVN